MRMSQIRSYENKIIEAEHQGRDVRAAKKNLAMMKKKFGIQFGGLSRSRRRTHRPRNWHKKRDSLGRFIKG